MLSILHHQGDSRSSFGFTRKVLGGGRSRRGGGAKGDACAGGPGQGELHRVQNPCRASTPCRGPPQFQCSSTSSLQTCNHLIFYTDQIFKTQVQP